VRTSTIINTAEQDEGSQLVEKEKEDWRKPDSKLISKGGLARWLFHPTTRVGCNLEPCSQLASIHKQIRTEEARDFVLQKVPRWKKRADFRYPDLPARRDEAAGSSARSRGWLLLVEADESAGTGSAVGEESGGQRGRGRRGGERQKQRQREREADEMRLSFGPLKPHRGHSTTTHAPVAHPSSARRDHVAADRSGD
jgi:hypothetical protein